MLFDAARVVLHDSRRFAQTAAGWVLRELYQAQPKEAIRFIRANSIILRRMCGPSVHETVLRGTIRV